jgi:hypothetical protein
MRALCDDEDHISVLEPLVGIVRRFSTGDATLVTVGFLLSDFMKKCDVRTSRVEFLLVKNASNNPKGAYRI